MSRYSQGLLLVALCVLGCFARPHDSNEQQDGQQQQPDGPQHDAPQRGGMGGMMQNPMMAKAMAAMSQNPFLKDLNEAQRAEFFAIKLNTTLTKGQIVSAVNNFLQTLPSNAQNDYAVCQANMTQWKTDMINKLKANLSAEGQALVDTIQADMEDQSLTYKETCHKVLEAVNGSSQSVKEELKAAAKAEFGDMMKGKMGARMGPGGGNVQVSGAVQGPAGGVQGNVRVQGGGPGAGGPVGMAGPGGLGGGPGGMAAPGGMGGGPMGMGMGAGGDPCEMMEDMLEHMGKMAAMMHHMPVNEDDASPEAAVQAAADAGAEQAS